MSLEREEALKKQLIEKFPGLAEKTTIQRERRLFTDVPVDQLREVLAFMQKEMSAQWCCTISGVDNGDTFGALYHISTLKGEIINVRIVVSKDNPKLPSISDMYPSVDLYERELEDMFGMIVEGKPAGGRYPLPDEWPTGNHPLRKDWSLDQMDLEPLNKGKIDKEVSHNG